MFALPKYGDGVCLARLDALLEALAIDRAALRCKSVVVTGSNGKGGTAAFCASIARAFGLRTGLFTSPHLFRFNERFKIDGVDIDDASLARLVARVTRGIAEIAARRRETFGAFEAQFALACLYFQEARCDVAVFEAGIGGRYDPVRLVGARTTCVTSVDLEHVELLGHALELISADKSDACAAGGTVIYGENCRPLRDHLAAYNRNRDVTGVFVRDEIAIAGEAVTADGQRFDLRIGGRGWAALQIGLAGAFQIDNAAVAAALFLQWLASAGRDAPPAGIDAALRSGLRNTRWPGRLDIVGRDPLVVIDVGHTPDGVKQALAGLRAVHGESGWVLVLGVSRDKKADAIVGTLAPWFATIICTAAHHKGADPQVIAEAVRATNPAAEIVVAPDIVDAVDRAVALARSSGRKVYVAGGLFLAIEFASVLRGGNPDELDFF